MGGVRLSSSVTDGYENAVASSGLIYWWKSQSERQLDRRCNKFLYVILTILSKRSSTQGLLGLRSLQINSDRVWRETTLNPKWFLRCTNTVVYVICSSSAEGCRSRWKICTGPAVMIFILVKQRIGQGSSNEQRARFEWISIAWGMKVPVTDVKQEESGEGI